MFSRQGELPIRASGFGHHSLGRPCPRSWPKLLMKACGAEGSAPICSQAEMFEISLVLVFLGNVTFSAVINPSIKEMRGDSIFVRPSATIRCVLIHRIFSHGSSSTTSLSMATTIRNLLSLIEPASVLIDLSRLSESVQQTIGISTEPSLPAAKCFQAFLGHATTLTAHDAQIVPSQHLH